MKTIIFTFLLCFSVVCIGQTRDGSFFEKGSRVCFVGNSITHNGEFYHNLLLFHITRFPESPVYFYNCGISGDVADGVLNRIEEDVLVHNPTHAVIMLGMNDVRRSLYTSVRVYNEDTLQLRIEAIDKYKKNLEKIVTLFISKGIKVILQKPTIYDQTVILSTPNNLGVNDALKTCSDFIDSLCKKYNLLSVDYWTLLNQINDKLQKNDPTATIIGPDRVHPKSPGHLAMTYQFLKSEGVSSYVSKIIIEKNCTKSSKNSLNCNILSFQKQNHNLIYTIKENALPFPTIEDQQMGLEVVPFTKELNMEILQINDIKTGQYKLAIDDTIIGVFSDKQFREGINLAEYKNTPQYGQSMGIRNKLEDLWLIESAQRNIKYIEYNPYYKTCPNKDDLTFVKSYLDSVFTVRFHKPYLNLQLEKYITNKPKEKEYIETSEMLRHEVYEIAKPSVHQFTIIHQ